MKFLKDVQGQIDITKLAIGSFIGMFVLFAVFQIAPVIDDRIGGTVDIPAGSDWNATENADIPTGADVWNDNAPLLLLVLAIPVIIAYLYKRT